MPRFPERSPQWSIVSTLTGYGYRMRSIGKHLFALMVLALITGTSAFAQRVDTSRPRIAPDTTVAAPARIKAPSRLAPPLSPSRAFVYSAVFPGLGQSRLDRGTSGALFATIELAAFTMVRRSRAELREVRRYRIDTLPSDFAVAGTTIVKSGTYTNGYTADLEKTRRLHVEDWLATMAFNHLFAGADAFVAAQLWDVPLTITAAPTPTGAMFVATLHW